MKNRLKEYTELRKNYCGKVFIKRNEVNNHVYEICESTCHECTAKDEFENDKKYSIVEKVDLIRKKGMEHKEITKEK